MVLWGTCWCCWGPVGAVGDIVPSLPFPLPFPSLLCPLLLPVLTRRSSHARFCASSRGVNCTRVGRGSQQGSCRGVHSPTGPLLITATHPGPAHPLAVPVLDTAANQPWSRTLPCRTQLDTAGQQQARARTLSHTSPAAGQSPAVDPRGGSAARRCREPASHCPGPSELPRDCRVAEQHALVEREAKKSLQERELGKLSKDHRVGRGTAPRSLEGDV